MQFFCVFAKIENELLAKSSLLIVSFYYVSDFYTFTVCTTASIQAASLEPWHFILVLVCNENHSPSSFYIELYVFTCLLKVLTILSLVICYECKICISRARFVLDSSAVVQEAWIDMQSILAFAQKWWILSNWLEWRLSFKIIFFNLFIFTLNWCNTPFVVQSSHIS